MPFKSLGILFLIVGLATCGPTPTPTSAAMPSPSPNIQNADFTDRLNGTTWAGIGVQNGGSRWSILAQFSSKSARTLYYDGDCIARWTLIEQSATSATYREEIVNSSRCIDTIVTVFDEGAGKLGYRVRMSMGGGVIATSTLTPSGSGNARLEATSQHVGSSVAPETTTPTRDCGTRPRRPSIPSRPAGLSCSSSAIKSRLDTCTAVGVAEVACGELLEGSDTRITTGALNGAACSAGTAMAQGNRPNNGDVAASAIIGAVDNAGESVGGLFGGLIRATAAGVKAGVVSDCRRDVRVQCDPEIALRPYRTRLANYEACLSGR